MEWFETWFNTPEYHELYQNRNDEEAHRFVHALFDHIGVPTPGLVLDLACGKGRHARQIHALGYEVDACDLSENSIAQAKAFEADGLHFFVQDMRAPFQPSQYDVVVNLFTSFGYFEHVDDNARVLANVQKALKPNGIFILDFFNATVVENSIVPLHHKTIGEREYEIRKTIRKGIIYKDIQIVQTGQRDKHFQEKVQLLHPETLRRMMDAAGLTVITEFGSYALSPFEERSSDRYLALARNHHDAR